MFDRNKRGNWSIKKHAVIILVVAVFVASVCSYYFFENERKFASEFYFFAFFVGVISSTITALSRLSFSSMEAKRLISKFDPSVKVEGYMELEIPTEESVGEGDDRFEKMVLKPRWIDLEALNGLRSELVSSLYISAFIGGVLALGSVLFFSGFSMLGELAIFPSYEAFYTPIKGNSTQAIFWCFIFACFGRSFKTTLNRSEDEVLDIYYSGLDDEPKKVDKSKKD